MLGWASAPAEVHVQGCSLALFTLPGRTDDRGY